MSQLAEQLIDQVCEMKLTTFDKLQKGDRFKETKSSTEIFVKIHSTQAKSEKDGQVVDASGIGTPPLGMVFKL